MKLRIGGLMLVLFWLVLPVAAQDSSNTINPAYKKIVWKNTTVKLTGPNGTMFSAPTVLQVTGGTGGSFTGKGGGIILAGGIGGPSHLASGGPITVTGGKGGDSSGTPGGAIQLTGGRGATGYISVPGGTGGSIMIAGGVGGGNFIGGVPGNGGSITLQAGAGAGGAGIPGDVILTGGNVGIGTATPANMLEVVAGGTTLADAWTTRSSRRFKTNIQPLQGALEKVEQLQGVSYQRKVDGKHEIGVVAEDVYQVVPEVVSRDTRSQEVQGVDYSRLAALLIEAVKSQQAELRSQRGEIQHLKAQIEQLTSNPGRGAGPPSRF